LPIIEKSLSNTKAVKVRRQLAPLSLTPCFIRCLRVRRFGQSFQRLLFPITALPFDFGRSPSAQKGEVIKPFLPEPSSPHIISSAHCLPHIVEASAEFDKVTDEVSDEVPKLVPPGTSPDAAPRGRARSKRSRSSIGKIRVLPIASLSDKYLVRVASPIFELAASLPR